MTPKKNMENSPIFIKKKHPIVIEGITYLTSEYLHAK